MASAVACAAEGYPFPTNLHLDANANGLSPPSQADLIHTALAEDWDTERLAKGLVAYEVRHATTDI